jgi:phosphoribosylformimino-5-aminoimidazole carboxamide ribotide isomerase
MIEIIPAIDIIEGKCVRLTRGDFRSSKVYGDPLEMAYQFEDHGLSRLHVVDLDGAREQRVVNFGLVEKIASRTQLVIDAGGGLRTDEDVRIMFESGVQMVTAGSIAVREPGMVMEWLARYGPGRIILGADFRQGNIAISGWHEETSLGLMQFIADFRSAGIRKIICTDIERDGMLEGPSLETYQRIKSEYGDMFLIASGGIGELGHIERLEQSGIDGVILGKSIYEGRISLKALQSYMIQNP